MAPGYTENDSATVRVTLTGVGELHRSQWSDYGVPFADVADAKSGTRTTIFLDNGRKLIIEGRHNDL